MQLHVDCLTSDEICGSLYGHTQGEKTFVLNVNGSSVCVSSALRSANVHFNAHCMLLTFKEFSHYVFSDEHFGENVCMQTHANA